MSLQNLERPGTPKNASQQLVSREVDLGTRYTPRSGDTLLTGTQAIARLLVEQHEADLKAG
ncbi:MAG TPA: hypothetical protein VLZ31_05730 [Microbacteriaceae bacterium]|nr:hypothetical protein [Microbacteriaceae bacterium]